jgi:predicted CoA-binding protein
MSKHITTAGERLGILSQYHTIAMVGLSSNPYRRHLSPRRGLRHRAGESA